METNEMMTEILRFRAPGRLVDALASEATRRMISKSALVRLAVLREIGLLDQADAGEVGQRREVNP